MIKEIVKFLFVICILFQLVISQLIILIKYMKQLWLVMISLEFMRDESRSDTIFFNSNCSVACHFWRPYFFSFPELNSSSFPIFIKFAKYHLLGSWANRCVDLQPLLEFKGQTVLFHKIEGIGKCGLKRVDFVNFLFNYKNFSRDLQKAIAL